MIQYEHRQIGYILLVSYCLVIAIAVWIGTATAFHPIVWIVIIAMSVVLFLFGWMTVTINARKIKIRFGLGLMRKNIRLKNVQSVRTVRNPWYYGWGIRYTPHGWLYNVSGFSAVEVQQINGRRFRIGTNEPEELRAAIERAVNALPVSEESPH